MAKGESRGKTSGRRAAREAGRFAIGRSAFGKISMVEGITVSRGLEEDLRRLDRVVPERRRAVLARKYGKK
jgi:hypothetical protein